jgi:rhodanese-related sulfurtransferase
VWFKLTKLKNPKEYLITMETHQIICFCQTESRSMAATTMHLKLGFQSANMKGGFAAWNMAQLFS